MSVDIMRGWAVSVERFMSCRSSQHMPRPKKPAAQKRAALAVYLPPKMLKKLQKVADREYRPTSAQALRFIERALKGSGNLD